MGCGKTNQNMAYREQMLCLNQLWSTWSEVEQVVALYSLVKKMNPVPARFFLNILTASNITDSQEIVAAENRANDPSWVSQIPDTKDNLATELLHHLPLLRSNNNEAKHHYLNAIPKALTNAVNQPPSTTTLEKARQLLTYSLIHPAITIDERRTLIHWLRALEEKLNDLRRPSHSHSNESGVASWTSDAPTKTRWSESPVSTSADQGQDDSKWTLEPLQSPNNSSRSSGSESTSEEPAHHSPHPGMRDVGAWLKSLRLHKYTSLLSSLAYEDLLALDEQTLESKGVTKGARHKIVLSISKLKDRQKQLINLEKDLMNEGNVNAALNELRAIILTPMPPTAPPNPDPPPLIPPSEEVSPTDSKPDETDQDLPSRFTRVVGKVCTQLLVSVQPDDEAVNSFLTLVEKCLNHEAFNPVHVKRLFTWKQQVLKIWHPLPPKSKDGRHMRRWSQQYGGESIGSFRSRLSQQRYSGGQITGLLVPGTKTLHGPPPPPHLITIPPGGILTSRNSLPGMPSLGVASLLAPHQFLAKRPSLQEVPTELRPHITLHRTRSAPSRPHQLPVSRPTDPRGHHDSRGSIPNSGSSGSSNASSRSNSGTAVTIDPCVGMTINHTSGNMHTTPIDYNIDKSSNIEHHSISLDPNITSTLDPSVALDPNNCNVLNPHPGLTPPLVTHTPPNDSADSEITNQLESLCLSMTEHALGSN